MSSRFGNQNLSLIGFSLIFLTLGSLLYLIHATHVTLEETRERLRFSDERLQGMTTQYEYLSAYKVRLEEAFINMKSAKASLLQNDQTARDELDELRDLCTRQVEALQEDLKTCEQKVDGGTKHQASPSVSSSASSRNYRLRSPGAAASGGDTRAFFSNKKSPSLEGQGSGKVSSMGASINSIPPPQPVSGNPNEDLAGNVLI